MPNLDPVAVSTYGSIAGVQEYIVVSQFTETSKPFTANDVAKMLQARSTRLDMKLAAAGYTTPVTTPDEAKGVLDEIVELQVAATIIERIVLGREPNANKVESAATWRREAQETLGGILSGQTPLPGSTAGTNRSNASTAGIITTGTSAFPRSMSDDMASHGGKG